MSTGFLYLLLLSVVTSSFSAVAEDISFDVGVSGTLQIVPSVRVKDLPGLKPGVHVLAERVHIHGLSRMKNLLKFSYAVTVKVSQLNSSLRHPNAEVCFHRNSSLGVGMCPQGQWQKLSKGSWSQKMSPFDHKLLDIRMARSSLEAMELTVEEEFSAYRTVFLVLGTVLITLASTLSESLIFYYSSAMAVGILLVILVVLFQGMKILPTGRGHSLAIFLFSTLVGIGSFLSRYLPSLLRTMLTEMGVSEDMYNPLAISISLFIYLAGAWLGFWAVRKLVLAEDGLIDTTVSQFVAWSIRIVGAVMILQCSLDPLLAAEALVSAIFISLILRKASRSRLLHRVYRKLRKTAGRSVQKLRDDPTDGEQAVPIKFQFTPDNFISPQSRYTTRSTVYSPIRGPAKSPSSPLSETESFYSTYHNTPYRRKISGDEWKAITKECTKKGLEELVSTPEFGRWAVSHAERITLAPVKEDQTNRWHRWLPWLR